MIAIDHYPHRLELAKQMGAEILNYREVDVREALEEMTGGIGPDAVHRRVGMESHGLTVDNVVDTVKAHTFLGTERPHALRQVILACRKGGRVSIRASMAASPTSSRSGADGEGPDREDRPDPRPAIHPEAAGDDRTRARSTRPS